MSFEGQKPETPEAMSKRKQLTNQILDLKYSAVDEADSDLIDLARLRASRKPWYVLFQRYRVMSPVIEQMMKVITDKIGHSRPNNSRMYHMVEEGFTEEMEMLIAMCEAYDAEHP